MKIDIFQSYQGDCLLIEDSTGFARILSDGGTPAAMRDSIASSLSAWEQAGKQIDLVYISHIDSDHIGGVAFLLDLAVQWKVYDFHQANGDPSPKPKLPRPPAIKAIWHNAFRDLITRNAGDIEELLAASASMLQSSRDAELAKIGYEHAMIATSVKEALTVSRLIKPDLLHIALNELSGSPQHSGKLLMARPNQIPESFGALEVTILCPTSKELSNLREGWNDWLRDETNRRTARKIRDIYAGQLDAGNTSLNLNAFELFGWQGVPAYKNVTAPNVASTVLLVKEGTKSLLLTGDNHPDMIVKGLKDADLIPDGHIHFDILKYPHHGSEHNISEKFPLIVSADHYIFCGDGSNTNPELSVLEDMFTARIGPPNKQARSPLAAGRPFKFWFSTAPSVQDDYVKQGHMIRVEQWAKRKKDRHGARFDYHFNTQPHTTILV
jgi:hypothetical protein